ncbi:hypothetical protein DL96DRAFT_997744 [Flagelloscypha sp. PMI_526]|nr:hypothetical protein DL96DRAFT_997744 [Flagelloscypha sp. PMI_526]
MRWDSVDRGIHPRQRLERRRCFARGRSSRICGKDCAVVSVTSFQKKPVVVGTSSVFTSILLPLVPTPVNAIHYLHILHSLLTKKFVTSLRQRAFPANPPPIEGSIGHIFEANQKPTVEKGNIVCTAPQGVLPYEWLIEKVPQHGDDRYK